jgi:hypothetical protein
MFQFKTGTPAVAVAVLLGAGVEAQPMIVKKKLTPSTTSKGKIVLSIVALEKDKN